MFELFAVTNRGIEAICADEMARIRGLQVTQTAYRRVHATFSGKVAELLALRTVDDLFIQLAEWQGIGSHRSTLALFEQLALDLNLWQAINIRDELQPFNNQPSFSVSANFVGHRNYSAGEIKSAMANGVIAISGWRYEEDDRQSDLNLRIFIEHDNALVGMRLARAPLYKRAYKQDHLPGSLKPSVAAALVYLAQPTPDHKLLDPFCGAGTILIEAATLGVEATGGDQEAAAIAAAEANAQAAGVAIDVRRWDARALPLADASIEYIVTNLPWGRQVEIETGLVDFYGAVCLEMARVVTARGKIVLLTNLPHLITLPALALKQQIEISLFGQQPTIMLFGPHSTTVS